MSSQSVIYVILEYGEIDLARLLAKQEAKRREGPGALLRENFIRLYWQQMLEVRSQPSPWRPLCGHLSLQEHTFRDLDFVPAPVCHTGFCCRRRAAGPPRSCTAAAFVCFIEGVFLLQAVSTIHEARIVHSDLKPANFLVVGGELKLIDFGIAKAIKADTTSIARENQVPVTVLQSLHCGLPLRNLQAIHNQRLNTLENPFENLTLDNLLCAGRHAELHVARGDPRRQQQHPRRPAHEGAAAPPLARIRRLYLSIRASL